MGMTMRVTRPGYDCLTDGTIDHYALYADQDYILIKEQSRGSVTVAANGTTNIVHNLGYIPFFLGYAFGSVLTDAVHGVYQQGWYLCNLPGGGVLPKTLAVSNTGTLSLVNFDSVSHAFKYFIFYDQQV